MTSFPKIHPYPPWTGPRNNSVGTDKARKRHSKTTDPSKKPEVAQALVPRRTSGPEREKMEVAGAVGLVMLPVLGRMVGALVLVLVSFLFLLFLLFAALPFDVNCVERLARPLTFLDRTAIRRQIVRRGNTNKVQTFIA